MTAAPEQVAGRTAFGPRFLAPLVLGTLLNAINSSMIAVTLTPIGRQFDASPAHTVWLVTVLYLATAIAQPVMGRLVDRYGPRRVLCTGLVLVAFAGLAGMFAPSLWVLLVVRVVLGLGTASGFPAAMAIIKQRTNALGLETVPGGVLAAVATSTQASMAAGPTLGAFLTSALGWQATFAVNIPLASAGLVLALLWLPADQLRRAGSARGIDLAGIGLFSATLLALLLLGTTPSMPLLLTGVALAAVLVWWQLRAREPFLDLRALGGNGALLRTYGRQALAYLAIYAFLYGYPQWLAHTGQLGDSAIGVALLPMSLTTVLLSAFGNRLGIKARGRLVLTAATLLAGSLALLFLSSDTALGVLVAVGFCFGLGQGLATVANQTALYAQAPLDRIGTLSGLFRTSQYIGALASTSVLALCFGSGVSDDGLGVLGLVLCGAGLVLFGLTALDRTLRGLREA
ncbi:MFS transporter [Sciscionella marina]|uniref:MFS transporter n=1 Tax=Sciscionella marina TaxID=508770 RepID=UPI00036822A0|nr:MFS transporter [Sciscionella marina]